MRLDELNPKPSFATLSGVDDYTHIKSWEQSSIDFARKHGFTPIGSGAFANVFKSRKYPFVIKVFASRDKGYIDWLKFCYANQSNPYVPKLRGKVLKVGTTMQRGAPLRLSGEANGKDLIGYQGLRNGKVHLSVISRGSA